MKIGRVYAGSLHRGSWTPTAGSSEGQLGYIGTYLK
jgi:hypothetical protein